VNDAALETPLEFAPAAVDTRQALELEPAAADALLAVELWDDVEAVSADLADLVGPLPAPGRAAPSGVTRVLWWEPQTWLVRAPLKMRDGLSEPLAAGLRERGAVTDVSGGFRRVRVHGPLWREFLMIGGVFDAEHGFPVGSTAGTVIHHLPVRLDAVDAGAVDAYVAQSYAEELLHHWRKAQARLASAAP
jgi:heterotetrameric sarcosine oxidase gamma subunit